MAKHKGKGLDTGIIKVSDSLTIDSRLKVGGILWLQEKYDMDFNEVMKVFLKSDLRDVTNLIVALAIQRNPDMDEPAVMAVINQLEINELTGMANKMSDVFKADAKNSKRPVAGNIQE